MLRLAVCCLVLGIAVSSYHPALEDFDSSSAPPPQPRTLQSELTLEFESEDRQTYNLNPGLYRLTSPRFPWPYPNNVNRQVTVRGRQMQTISIRCFIFSIEFHRSCAWDYLSINGVKYCGTWRRISTIRNTVLNIIFRSDGSVRGYGFRCIITVPNSDRCCGIPNRSTRIVGGMATEVNEYGWQAGVVASGSTRTFCGGSVINTRYVMTAAHCTAGTSASQIQVLLREHVINSADGELRYGLSSITAHPSYTSASSSGYDFSLLGLSTAIDFPSLNNRVAPVCLPAGGDFASVDAVVSGWGTTAEGGSQATILQEVTVRTMTNTQCMSSYSSINPTMICAGVSGGGKDSCQGDSGGPMATLVAGRYTLIGVVSWGRGCARPGFPGVYARVTSVSDWIQQNTADASLC